LRADCKKSSFLLGKPTGKDHVEGESLTDLVIWGQSAGNGTRPWEVGTCLKPAEERNKYMDRQ